MLQTGALTEKCTPWFASHLTKGSTMAWAIELNNLAGG
jgi:hypothetical protein